MALDYRFLTYPHFPKGQVPSYGLTLHLWDNISDVQHSSPSRSASSNLDNTEMAVTEQALFKSGPRLLFKMKAGPDGHTQLLRFTPGRDFLFNRIPFFILPFVKGAIFVQVRQLKSSDYSHITPFPARLMSLCWCIFVSWIILHWIFYSWCGNVPEKIGTQTPLRLCIPVLLKRIYLR